MPFRVDFLFVFIAIASVGCYAQTQKIDSLESLIASVPSDTTKVWLLNDLVNALKEKDNEKALVYAIQARDLSELLRYNRGLAQALVHTGWIYYRRGDYSKSLSASTQALKVSEGIPDHALTGAALVNIAAIYYEQKQYALAITNFKLACKVADAIGNTLVLTRGYNNIAFAFLGLKQLDSANHYAQQALLKSTLFELPYMVAFAHRTIGDIAFERQNLPDALEHYTICQQLSLSLGNTFLKSSVLHRIAKTYFVQGKSAEAIAILTENISVAEKFGYKDELERAYKLLSEIHYSRKELDKAFKFQSAYVSLHDSLYSQRSSEQLALMQIRFDTEMKQAQIELLTKDSELKAEQIKSQQVWIYFYVGCLSLMLILAFVLFYNNRHDRLAKAALEEKNHAIQQQAQQLQNLNSTKDKLFSIISHDLRSPVASLKALMEIVSTSGISQEEFVDISKVLKRNLDSVFEDLNNLLMWAQTQLRGIHAVPEAIDLRTLVNEKIELYSEPSGTKHLQIINNVPEGTMVWADRNHLRLVIRNLLGNAIKFNRLYGSIEVRCSEKGEEFQISVTDTGIGMTSEDLGKLFNAETHFTRPGTQKEKGIGIGLLLAKEFIEKNQGSIEVSSEAGKGATFIFTLKAYRQPELV